MVADLPYGLDFFQKITNIHFGGGDWFFVFVEATGDTGAIVAAVTFPGQAGGTPGFNLGLDGHDPGGFFPNPHTITNADLSAPMRTLAGADVIGFGINGGFFSAIYLSLNKLFPATSFPVLVTISGVQSRPSFGEVQISTINRKLMVPGTVIDAPATPIPTSTKAKGWSTNTTFLATIDPKTLLVK